MQYKLFLLILIFFTLFFLTSIPSIAALKITNQLSYNAFDTASTENSNNNSEKGILGDLNTLYFSSYEFDTIKTLGVLVGTFILIKNDESIYNSIHDTFEGSSFKTNILPPLDNSGHYLFMLYSVLAPTETKYKVLNFETFTYTYIGCRVIKNLIGGSRPKLGVGRTFIGPNWSEDEYDGMPSGHTAVSFALAYVLSKEDPKHKWIYYSVATTIGVLRIIREEHWPSDVFAGAAVGTWFGNRAWNKQDMLGLNWKF